MNSILRDIDGDIDNIVYFNIKPSIHKEEDMSIASVELEEFEIPEEEETTIEDKSGGSLKFAFIGLGQCGGRIAEAFYNTGYTKTFIVNTAEQDLNKNTVPNKMLIQLEGRTGGAGKDMNLAHQTVESEKDSIYNKMVSLFGKVDHIFVCAGLGGGTGGGSITVTLETAKRYMEYIDVPDASKKVGAIVTLPTHGEASSPLVAGNAYEKGNQLSDLADLNNITPLIIVDNDKVKQLYKKLTVAKFFPTINNSVAQLLHVFNTIALEPSEYITFDTTDFQSVLEAGGHMIMGVSTVREFDSSTSISEALRKNLSKTLLAGGFEMERAKAVACIVVGGNDIFENVEGLMGNIEMGFDTMAQFTGNAKVHRGIYSDESRAGRINVYTLIGGLEKPTARYEKMKPANYKKGKK
jgi:cell division protein FtsZ